MSSVLLSHLHSCLPQWSCNDFIRVGFVLILGLLEHVFHHINSSFVAIAKLLQLI
jgi:hypothetical protein